MKIDIDINNMYDTLIVSIKNNKMTDDVTNIIKRLEANDKQTIIGKKENNMYILEPDEVVCFYTEGQKVKASTMTDSYEVKEKLYQLESSLESFGFIKLSKYAVANIKMIKKIEVEFNGSLIVHFKNSKTESISRRQVSKVKIALGL